VFAGIALFALQYASSGILATTPPVFPQLPHYAVDLTLAAWGVAVWVAGPYTPPLLTSTSAVFVTETTQYTERITRKVLTSTQKWTSVSPSHLSNSQHNLSRFCH